VPSHYINDAELIRAARAAVRADDKPAVEAALARWLARQRTAPALVGTTVAAKILGIAPPHVSRLREQGRMPDPIPVDGSVDVYVREEVEALGAELRAEREARRRRREERAAT
jgi:hypothetical protein